MALHHQPQRCRHTLPHHIDIPLRGCRCPRADNEDSTLRPWQYPTHRRHLQSIRHRSRNVDDFLGPVSVSFWFCKLHYSITNWLPGFGVPTTERDELLVLSLQWSHDDSQLLLRGSSRPWLDALLTPDRRSVYPDDWLQPRSWRSNTDDCLNNHEFCQLPRYDAQDESARAEVEVHVSFFLGHLNHDLHDALRVSFVSRSRRSTICRQGIWHGVLFLNPGRISPMGQCVLVLRASRSLHRPVSGSRNNCGHYTHFCQEAAIRRQVRNRSDGTSRDAQFRSLGSSYVRYRNWHSLNKAVHGHNHRDIAPV